MTMNMPAKSGSPIHQIICDYPAKDLSDFVYALSQNDLLIVEEFYKDPNVNSYYSVGHVAVNYRFIGKVKMITHANHQNRTRELPKVLGNPSLGLEDKS